MARLDKKTGMWPRRRDPARTDLVADGRLGEEPLLNELSSIGAQMRISREQIGHDLLEVARQLRIRHSYLQAIEAGAFSALPGMTYAIGYVRTYAQFLGLDPQFAVKRFKAEVEGLDRRHELAFPSPPPEGKVPGGAILFVSLVLAAIGYGGWYYLSASDRTLAEVVPEIPKRFAFLIGADDGSAQSLNEIAVRPAEPPISQSQLPDNTVSGSEVKAEPVQVAVAASIGVAAESAEEPKIVNPKSAGGVTVVLTGTGSESDAQRAVAPQGQTTADTAQTSSSQTSSLQGQDQASTAANQTTASQSVSTPAVPSDSVAASADATRDVASAAITAPIHPPAPPTSFVAIPAAPNVSSPGLLAAHAEAPANNSAGAEAAAASANGTIKGRIVIRANSDSWVQVRAGDSATLMTRVMRSGDTYVVPDRKGLKLFTGNAGALDILVDGQPAPKLGPIGKIARNVRLEPKLLREGRASVRN
jgi:cytoskeleton protein RodZ